MARAWLTVLVAGLVFTSLLTACSGSRGMAACGQEPPVADAHMSLFALDAATGAVRWSRRDLPLYANGYTHIDGPNVVVSRGLTGESFDVATGTTGPAPPGTVPVPVTVGARTIDASLPSGVHVAALWDTAVVSGTDAVVIDADGDGNGELVGFDPATTNRRWSFPLDRPSHSNLLLQDGVVLVTTGDSIPSCA